MSIAPTTSALSNDSTNDSPSPRKKLTGGSRITITTIAKADGAKDVIGQQRSTSDLKNRLNVKDKHTHVRVGTGFVSPKDD